MARNTNGMMADTGSAKAAFKKAKKQIQNPAGPSAHSQSTSSAPQTYNTRQATPMQPANSGGRINGQYGVGQVPVAGTINGQYGVGRAPAGTINGQMSKKSVPIGGAGVGVVDRSGGTGMVKQLSEAAAQSMNKQLNDAALQAAKKQRRRGQTY